MPNWRAVAAGVVAFLGAVGAALAYSPPSLFVAGFCGGAVAGLLAGGVRSGLWHGLLAGVAELLVAVAALGLLLAAYDPQYARPGLGYAIAVFPLVGALFAAEATIAGAIGGALRRAVDSR